MDIYYKKNNNKKLFNDLKHLNSNITKLQNYIPTYKKFFNLNDNTYNTINLNQKYYINRILKRLDDNNYVINISNADNSKNILDVNAFIKFSPLLDTIKYMCGKYNNDNKIINELPKLNHSNNCYKKTLDPNNSAYTDGFFSYLSSLLLNNKNFIHGVNFYGSFLGIKKELIINIEDDIDYLYNSDFFHENKGKLYDLLNFDECDFFNNDTRKYKQKIRVIDNSSIDITNKIDNISKYNDKYDDLFTSDLTENNLMVHNKELIYNNDNITDNSNNNTSIKNSSTTCSSRSSNTDLSSMDSDIDIDNDSYSDSSSISNGDDDILSIIYNFPVNIIIMEKLTNTLDKLMDDKRIMTNNEWASCLFQIIIILITYQKVFDFTHNDLHTNNIMYINTMKKYIYYKYDSKHYKIPTYGRIYKIIDFGRSIYRYSNKLLFSDSFHHKGDAAYQYNCEPYYNPKKKKIIPNKSFDLCRLGCSLYDYFITDMDNIVKDPITSLVIKWCTDDKGRNILYKKDGNERYEDFKLYKMISRTVHNHIPSNEINNKIFNKFITSRKKINKKHKIINIDKLVPMYV